MPEKTHCIQNVHRQHSVMCGVFLLIMTWPAQNPNLNILKQYGIISMGTKDGQREQQEQIRNNKTWEIKLKTRHKQLKAIKIKVEITPRQRLESNTETKDPM